jgi:lantibiotic leader peptide-processing serine protease
METTTARNRSRGVRLLVGGAVAATVVAGATGVAGSTSRRPADSSPATHTYVVLARTAGSTAGAEAAATAAGGEVVRTNAAIGAVTVRSSNPHFVGAVTSRTYAVAGAARDRRIGAAPGAGPVRKRNAVEREQAPGSAKAAPVKKAKKTKGADTLAHLQWDMDMIHAPEAHAIETGSKKVRVGILDTGIDASNPDLAPNFDWRLSRNFTTDMPDIDGPCEVASCVDPAHVDDGGHGTHVAGTVAAAANGVGIVGVAPDVDLVNLRAGQDSGYFFLQPSLDALTFAADNGIDVVNMSYYVDPWLYNCANNPADSPEAQQEQRTIVASMNRALDYAHDHGVTLISAMGNEHTDLGKPGVDATSPDYPPGTSYERTIDNATCLSMPSEGNHVLNVTAVGPSTKKADYSNYGLEHAWVAAPGGWFRDGFGTDTYRTDANMILSTYPLKVAQEEGAVDEDGNIVPEAAGAYFKDCTAKGRCGYYTYLQGTSMASPHAVGVAALAIAHYGTHGKGGMSLAPDLTGAIVAAAATETPCPVPPLQTYTNEGRDATFNALCEGSTSFNGFYGHGIIDAYRTVTAFDRR